MSCYKSEMITTSETLNRRAMQSELASSILGSLTSTSHHAAAYSYISQLPPDSTSSPFAVLHHSTLPLSLAHAQPACSTISLTSFPSLTNVRICSGSGTSLLSSSSFSGGSTTLTLEHFEVNTSVAKESAPK